MAFFKTKQSVPEVDFDHLPRHVAIIMDGNGRWAKRRGLPRTAGHKAGAETFRTITNFCKEIGIEYLTVYAFSTENWRRPETEVSAIMGLLEKYLLECIEKMERDQINLRILGDTTALSPELRRLCERTQKISTQFQGRLQANVCLNYGGRDEIVQAARAFAADCAAGKLAPDALDEEMFSRYLYTADIPDPDLIIRPSGELRLSNFLSWQSAYSEFYFSDILWPDFTKEDLLTAIADFQQRSRRYGGV